MKIFEITEQADEHTNFCKQVAMTLRENCDPYLDMIGNKIYYNTLYRGVKHLKSPFQQLPCPSQRTPVDTPMAIHEIADEWFFNKFGQFYRSNAVFCTGDKGAASFYGIICAVFPIDRFEFCYSPVYKDLYSTIETNLEQYGPDMSDKQLITRVENTLNKGKYMSTGIVAAINAESEVMLHCDAYYMLQVGNTNILYDVQKQLDLL